MIEMGQQVHFSIGSEKNVKLTTLEDKFLGAFFAADQSEQQAVWKILEKYMDL